MSTQVKAPRPISSEALKKAVPLWKTGGIEPFGK